LGGFSRQFYQIGCMHIGLLNDPNNFHTQKWGQALRDAGAEVTVFSFDEDFHQGLPSVRVPTHKGTLDYNYRSYLKSGPQLRAALEEHKVDLVNALNITPFGVWAAQSRFHPWVGSAMGADILEYPPRGQASPLLATHAWDNVEGSTGLLDRLKSQFKRKFFKVQVDKALRQADLITGDNQTLVDAVEDWFGIPPEKTRLLRWGVEPDLLKADAIRIAAWRKRLGIAEGSKVILSPRGAKAIYQASTILEGMGQFLAETQENVHCIVLSAGYQIASKVTEEANRLEAEFPNFSFISEQIPREEMTSLWHLADIFISAPIYDGYSASVAEGRYLGVIPLVNDIPGNQEVIQHLENGWVTQPFTSTQLNEDLAVLVARFSELKERFGTKNREWIENHSLISENASQFLAWANELTKQNP